MNYYYGFSYAIFKGLGDEGQLGHGNKSSVSQPKLISAFENVRIKIIATGHSHSSAVTSR